MKSEKILIFVFRKKTNMLFKIMESNYVPFCEIPGAFAIAQNFTQADAGRFQAYRISSRGTWRIFRHARSHAAIRRTLSTTTDSPLHINTNFFKPVLL